MLCLLAYAVAGLTIVFAGALLLGCSDRAGWRPLALAIAVATGCLAGAALLAVAGDPYQEHYRISLVATLLYRARQVLPCWGFAAAAWYFMDRATRRAALLRREEADRSQLVARMVEARLQLLEAQVEPHFIFNTLANIRRLSRTDPSLARLVVDRFATYLRASLPQMRDNAATLGREVDLARAYLDVQKVRMGRRLAYAIDVKDSLRRRAFPPMMLISLVENAIKHGLNPSIDGGTIRIEAVVRDQALQVSVADTGCGFTKTMGSGVGLANARARLAAAHGARGRLLLAANAPQGIVATIDLPLDGTPAASAPGAAEALVAAS
jgi:signal transduction histidine kinase